MGKQPAENTHLTRRQLKLKQEQEQLEQSMHSDLNGTGEIEQPSPIVNKSASSTDTIARVATSSVSKRGRKPGWKKPSTTNATASIVSSIATDESEIAEPTTPVVNNEIDMNEEEVPHKELTATSAVSPKVLAELTTNQEQHLAPVSVLNGEAADLAKPAEEAIVQREQQEQVITDIGSMTEEEMRADIKSVRTHKAAAKAKAKESGALNCANDEDYDEEDDDDDDSEMDDVGEYESDPDSEHNDSENKLNGSAASASGSKTNVSKDERDKLRRRLPLSIKELIDYHSGNGKSIKEIVSKINQVCKSEEKVSYGYVQKYLYRKKLEATTAKKARYYRKKYGFVYRRMRRKPLLTDHHRGLRMQWCGKYQDDTFDKDIFIGKTALKPFLASLNQLKGQTADPEHPKSQTTLHLWGAISRRGASPLQIFDGSLTTAMYLEILLENIVPFIAENFPAGHRFHQDNNPKHSAKLSQEFLASTGINWVKSPPRSHDLNPIELVWADLIQNVSKRLPKTIGQVVVAVKDYWKTLTPEKCCEFIDKLVDIVPKVIEKNGEWITPN